MNFSN